MATKTFGHEVLGIGAPIIDYVIEVSEEDLSTFSNGKGGMQVVNYQTFEKILHCASHPSEHFLGGSAANTIRGLANLGHSCAFTGKIGKDLAGRKFSEGMKTLGVHTKFLFSSDTPTAQVICLITPDKERTMRAFLGASGELEAEDLTPEMFEGVQLVHLEGYTLLKPKLARRAMEMAKAAGAIISFDLGSFEIVEANLDVIVELLSRYVTIVFANQDESHKLTQISPEKACSILKDFCDIAVVLLGKEGCLVGSGSKQIACSAFPVHSPIDTTGAGDLFASGFLHGYLRGHSLQDCAHFGALTGAAVVQVHGVEIPQPDWMLLKDKIKNHTNKK